MSVNKYQPYLHIYVEDAANSELATGFLLGQGAIPRQVQIQPPSGGWENVVEAVGQAGLQKNDNKHLLLLLDFDERSDRRELIAQRVGNMAGPAAERIFVFGVWSEPEKLKAALGHLSCEGIGKRCATECNDTPDTIWSHELVKHNESERKRLQPLLASFGCTLGS